jgi:hypothetical protein
MVTEQVRAEAARNGTLAARLGVEVTACPFDLARSPEHRALARIWVRAYLAARPPTPAEVRYDQ